VAGGSSHKGKKLNLSDEERKARSERAKRMNKERVKTVDPQTGEEIERAKFGGPQTVIHVKKTSDDLIQSIVDATEGDEVQVLVIKAYVEALTSGKRAEKLRAAKGLVEILEGHKKQKLAERRALNDEQRNDLLGGILHGLGLGQREGEEILDGEFSVVEAGTAGRDPAGVPELESGERAAD
jgi:hypothetical protein